MRWSNAVIIIVFCASCAGIVSAQESICFKTGFCVEAASHLVSDGVLIIQNGSGTLQFPADQVDTILPLTALKALATGRGNPGDAAKTQPEETLEKLLDRAALHEGLEPDLIRSVAMVESGINRDALSPKGAIGLMQLMPATALRLSVNPKVASENALGGAAFLREMLLKYHGNSMLALAAYNAGPGAVDRYKGVPPYAETRRYVVRVLSEYERLQRNRRLKEVVVAQAKYAGDAASKAAIH